MSDSRPSEEDQHYERIVQAEVAMEVINRARTLVQARIFELEKTQGDPAEAERLAVKRGQLYAVLRTVDYREPVRVAALIEQWGPLVRDEARFWQVMRDDRSLLAA